MIRAVGVKAKITINSGMFLAEMVAPVRVSADVFDAYKSFEIFYSVVVVLKQEKIQRIT